MTSVLKDLVRSVSSAEVVITRAQSLLSKFTQDFDQGAGSSSSCSELRSSELHGFVSDLLEQPEVNVIGAARAPLGVIIHRLFINSHKVVHLFHLRAVFRFSLFSSFSSCSFLCLIVF